MSPFGWSKCTRRRKNASFRMECNFLTLTVSRSGASYSGASYKNRRTNKKAFSDSHFKSQSHLSFHINCIQPIGSTVLFNANRSPTRCKVSPQQLFNAHNPLRNAGRSIHIQWIRSTPTPFHSYTIEFLSFVEGLFAGWNRSILHRQYEYPDESRDTKEHLITREHSLQKQICGVTNNA